MPRLSYADLRASTHRYILELRISGLTLRLSSGPAAIDSADGAVQVLDGLDGLAWDDGLDMLSTEAPEMAMSVQVVLPGVDVAELVAAGHDLGAATAELSRWVGGTTWEMREVLLRARVTEPQYGAEGEPVSFTLAAEPYADRTSTHRPGQAITPTTYPSLDAPDISAGRPYPIVFGAPGWVQETGEQMPGSPALVVSRYNGDEIDPVYPRVLVAGHRASAGLVSISHLNEDDEIEWQLLEGGDATDNLGQYVTEVQLLQARDQEEMWVSWTNQSGGLLNRRQDGVIRTAGELLDYLLDLTQLDVDQGRMDAAAVQLEGFRLSGYIDERCNLWQWIRDNMLPILPVSIHRGPDGLYPVVWRYDATASQAVEHLSADRREVTRVAPIRYTDVGDVANEITLSWALDARQRSHRHATTLSGEPGIERGMDVLTTHRSRVSWLRYGRMVRDPLSTDVVYDPATAAAIVSWLGAYHALPARMLEYEGGAELLHLDLGDVVTVTDAEVHLSRQVAIVTEIRDGGTGRVGLVLRTIEDPSRVT